jgi:GNAT superfamily N-acetyltransferase
VLKAIDDQSVWADVCLFVAKPFRRSGVSVALLKGAIDYVQTQGGRILGAYPISSKTMCLRQTAT